MINCFGYFTLSTYIMNIPPAQYLLQEVLTKHIPEMRFGDILHFK